MRENEVEQYVVLSFLVEVMPMSARGRGPASNISLIHERIAIRLLVMSTSCHEHIAGSHTAVLLRSSLLRRGCGRWVPGRARKV